METDFSEDAVQEKSIESSLAPQTSDGNSGLIFEVGSVEGAKKMNRIVLLDNKPFSYEYYYQTESGPCAALTFANLWSLTHGSLPKLNIDRGLINNGTTRAVWTENFSLIHGNNPKNEAYVIEMGMREPTTHHENASNLVSFLDTIEKGSIVCGTKEHCNAIHRFNDNQYVLIEPNDLQGLRIMSRDETVEYVQSRFTSIPEYRDYFYFIGPEINLE